MRVIILPDSIVVGVVTCLLSEGSFSRERLREACIKLPFIESPSLLSCWVVPLDGLPFQPWYGWYLVGMFWASLVISRWSYPLGWSTKGGFPSFPFSALVEALQSPKAPFKLHMSIGGNVGRRAKLEPQPRVVAPPSAGIGWLPCRRWVEGLNGGRGGELLT